MLTQNPLICKFGAVEEGGSFNWVEKIEPEREHVSFPPFFSCHNIPFSSLSLYQYLRFYCSSSIHRCSPSFSYPTSASAVIVDFVVVVFVGVAII